MEVLNAGQVLGGIFCDFYFPHAISSDILPQLEEKIRHIVREKREIRVLEMVPFSASELLKKQGQPERAEIVLQQEGVVHLVQVGHFYDWSEGFHVSHTGETGVFRLLEKKSLAKGVYRIFGYAGVDKKELKQLINCWESFPEKDHDRAGFEQGFWERIEGERIWLSRGLEVKRRFCAFLRNNCLEAAAEVGCASLESLRAFASKYGVERLFGFAQDYSEVPGERGLLDEADFLVLQGISFGNLEENCTSFLQLTHKTLTILGFTYRVCYSGRKRKGGALKRALAKLAWDVEEEGEGDPVVGFFVQDALGCEWCVASVVELQPESEAVMSLPIERNIALLLEQGDARLPFWLAPEHMRILPVGKGHVEAAERECLFFQERGYRAEMEELLKEPLMQRLRRAEREKVPFVLVVGDREVETGDISLRRPDGVQETTSREGLLMLLQEVDRLEN